MVRSKEASGKRQSAQVLTNYLLDVQGLTLIVIVVGALFILLFRFYKPYTKGYIGEYITSRYLNRLDSQSFKILDNLLLFNGYKSSQIDHLVVSTFGIFVIETKNYKGWIFGSEKSKYWTQTLYQDKYKLRNPIQQCWGHVRTLKSVLPEYSNIPIQPIVVFTGSAELKISETRVPVLYAEQLVDTIYALSESEVLPK